MISQNLQAARDLLAKGFITGVLHTRQNGIDRVCAMGALSMGAGLPHAEYPSLLKGHPLDPEMETLAKALDSIPPEQTEFPWKQIRTQWADHDPASENRAWAAERILVNVNDHFGQEAILKIFDSAICIAKQEESNATSDDSEPRESHPAP